MGKDKDGNILPDPPAGDKGAEGADPVAASLAKINAELGDLRNAVTGINHQQQQQQAPPPGVPDKTALTKEFYKDPLAMVTTIAQTVAQHTQAANHAATMPALMQIARDKVRASDPEVFDKYEPEIVEKVNRTNPQNHGNPEVWQTAFNLVRGSHFDEVMTLRQKKANDKHDGPAAPSAKPMPAPKETPLVAEEQEFVRNFQITTEGFRRGKEIIDGQAKRGPSSWDKAFTFDSAQRRREQRAKVPSAPAGKG